MRMSGVPCKQWANYTSPHPVTLSTVNGALWWQWQAALRLRSLGHFIFSGEPEFSPASNLVCPQPCWDGHRLVFSSLLRKDRQRDTALYWTNNLPLKFGIKRQQILATLLSISPYS